MPPLRERKSDIYLLFRKFSADFAAKYGCSRVALDLGAISLLSSYRWPGNVRQLKHVAEPVTALESKPSRGGSDKVELGPGTLSRYIPDEQDSLLPAQAGPQPSGSGLGDSDKQMIVKAILDLKQDVERLKQMASMGPRPAVAPAPAEEDPEEQMPEEQEPQDFNMRKANDDLIEKVLAKHGGKVKPAAAELGISERTIYRKLAERKGR